MEKSLEEVLTEVLKSHNVSGSVVSDKQGLCLGYMGIACPESSGILTAIADYAGKLAPNESEPTIILEGSEKQCIIQANDKLVVSMHKNLSSK